MFGQLANVFGRRWPLIFSAVIFVVGSGICGGYVAAFSMFNYVSRRVPNP